MLIKEQWFYEINAQCQRQILNSRHMGLLNRSLWITIKQHIYVRIE